MTCTPHRTKAGIFRSGSEHSALTRASEAMTSRLKRQLRPSELPFIFPAVNNNEEGFGILFSIMTPFGGEVIKWVRTL